jgi:hypothetical protein
MPLIVGFWCSKSLIAGLEDPLEGAAPYQVCVFSSRNSEKMEMFNDPSKETRVYQSKGRVDR